MIWFETFTIVSATIETKQNNDNTTESDHGVRIFGRYINIVSILVGDKFLHGYLERLAFDGYILTSFLWLITSYV